MNPTPAQEASDAMMRVAALSPDDRASTSRKRGGASRVQILTLLQASQDDLSVEELSEDSGLHVNTIRGHIDVLLAGGHVESVQAEPQGRGRPKLKYRAVPNPDSPYEDLSRALGATLTDAQSAELARQAAARWAEQIPPVAPADTPDEAVDQAADALRGAGFAAAISPLGDSITLGSCPYAELVAEHPIICDIHTELLSSILEDTKQDVAVAGVDVWVKPGVCQARLTRVDLSPTRTATPGALDGAKPDLKESSTPAPSTDKDPS